MNIYQASKNAMKRALADLSITPEHLLVDAMTLDTDIPQTSLIKGDARSISIAAASIMAKVFRDNLMKDYHGVFPHYGFDQNAGYGTENPFRRISCPWDLSYPSQNVCTSKQYVK